MDRLLCIHSKVVNNKFSARFLVNHNVIDKSRRCQYASDLFVVCGLVTVQLKADVNLTSNYKVYILLNCNKCYQNDSMEYVLKISSPQLKMSDTYINSNNVMDCLLYTYDNMQLDFIFDIHIGLNVKTYPKFSALYDDTDFTDIELIGIDGSIAMHRLVLACCSPVMKTMLTGDWKETKEGRVNAPGLTKLALEQLKNYLYLDKLPYTSSELEPLLDFACCYMMTDLMELCATKILFSVSAETALHYLEMARKYKLKKLLYGILKINQEGGFNIQNLLSSYCGNDWIL